MDLSAKNTGAQRDALTIALYCIHPFAEPRR